jgi:hypothetical protein
MYQINDTDLWGDISYDFGLPILSLFILLIMMLLMLYFYYKVRKFLPIVWTYSFSLIFGIMSLGEYNIPFSPYFQLAFLTFQTLFLLFGILKFKGIIDEMA